MIRSCLTALAAVLALSPAAAIAQAPPAQAQTVYRNVTLIDDQIGRILAVIEARGELADTAIVFTSDHGEMNGDAGWLYKGNFLDPAVRVPLLVRPAAGFGGFPSGRRSEQLAAAARVAVPPRNVCVEDPISAPMARACSVAVSKACPTMRPRSHSGGSAARTGA